MTGLRRARTVWKAEIIDRTALVKFVLAECRHDLILINEKVLDAYAKSMREGASIPGVRFFAEAAMSSRGA